MKFDKSTDSIIASARKQGIRYSAVLFLIGANFLNTIDTIDAARHVGFENYYDLEFASYIFPSILIVFIYSLLFGVPVIGLIASYASKILAERLISDYRKEILSAGMARLKGLIVGISFGLSISFGFAAILFLTASPPVELSDLFQIISNSEDSFFASLLYLPPLLGAISGYKLGAYLSKYLSAIIEPIPI